MHTFEGDARAGEPAGELRDRELEQDRIGCGEAGRGHPDHPRIPGTFKSPGELRGDCQASGREAVGYFERTG